MSVITLSKTVKINSQTSFAFVVISSHKKKIVKRNPARESMFHVAITSISGIRQFYNPNELTTHKGNK